MATDEDASRAGLERADVASDCDISGLAPSDPDVYTKPQMRDRIKAEIYCSDKGGDPGEWSARKAQLTVQRYEAEGGGYKDEGQFTDSQKDLMVWTEQDWEYGGGEEARYLPKDFWEELSEEEKERVNETKEQGSEEGKQFVSLPDEIQERFAEWREENREKYLEDARENPPGSDLRQRSLARDAYAVLQDYIDTWEPHYQPKKLDMTRARRDGEFWNVVRADARLLGFSDPLTPLHFLFFENGRITQSAALYRTKNLGVGGLPDDEPGIFLRFFNDRWNEEGKVVEEEEINDSTFLRENGSAVTEVEGFGTPKLFYSFETVSSALEVATPPISPQEPSVGLGSFTELEPQDLQPNEFVDRLVEHVRLASPTENKMQASKPDDAERALREAVENLRALKRQLAHVLQEKKTTFIHEFQHHFDRSRMPDDAVVGSSTLTGPAGLPSDEYFNVQMEVNARYQEGLAEFEDAMLSDPDFMRSKIKNGFDERDLIRLLKQFTPFYEKLDEENQRRLITRWAKYYNQIVEPRIERLEEGIDEGQEDGGGLPEDLQRLLEAAETLADAQATLKSAIEEAGGPLARSMEADRRLEALDTKIREGFSALREKAKEKGYDFDTIVERTALEPVRDNPDFETTPRENKPEDRFHVRRGEEHTDPDDYVTGFSGEGQNTFTREGVEGAKFRMWFGDWTDEDGNHSVVTDEDGRPLKVYHGTKNGGFNRFMVGEELRDDGSPGVFFTESRRHARSYSGSNEDIMPTIIGPADLTDPNLGFEVEERRIEKRAFNVLDGGEVIDTVLERDPAMERILDDYEEEGFEIERTTVDRYLVEHRGMIMLENGTEDEKIAALEKILQEANDRAEIPPRQEEGILTAYLNIRDPLVLDFEGQTWQDPPESVDFYSIDEASRFARNAGYDGLIAKNVMDPGPETRYSGTATEYIVFDGDQVAVQGARSGQIAIPRAETDPRLNPSGEQEIEDFTEAALDEHVELARRQNPEYTRETYPGVFEDFDDDEIPTVDDPHPLTPGDEETVEEVSLAEEIDKLLGFREDRAGTTEEAEERLSRWVPGDATIKSRTKTPYSILNKLRRKRLEGPKGIDDVSGAMVVVRDFARLREVRKLIEEEDVIGDVQEVENHYELPGPYRAVHYIVEVGGAPVEIQLKTQRQATLANTAHGPYKRGVVDNDEMDRIAELAHRADTGEEEAADTVDALLSGPDELEDRLTERENPPAEATVDVPGGPSYTVEPEDVILREGASHEDLSREKIAAPPDKARKMAQKARKWKEKGAPGMHETGMRRMLQIGAGYQLSPAEMEVVKNWFSRKKHEKEKGYHKMESWDGPGGERPSESLLSWWGWGGEPMMGWTEDMLEQMPDRTRLTEKALEKRENPLVDAQVDTDREVPIVTDSFFVDVTTEVIHPSPGTDRGFRLETSSLGETYAYGFSRTPPVGGEEFEGLAELSWIQVDESFQGEGVGVRLLGDVLRFLSATGADHVAVRPISDAARGLNARAEEVGLWHQTMKTEKGEEVYAIDVGPKSRLGVPLAGHDFEFDADRDDVEDAIRFLYDPSDLVWRAAGQSTDARPWTYAQPLRPASSSGDLEGEYNRDVEIYESFREAPDVRQENGFFFRTDAPITVDDLTRTSAEPVGIDTRTWTVLNAISSYQDRPGLPEFAIINRSKKWLMEFEQGEGEDEGKTLLTFSRAGSRDIETHRHNSVQDALEESLRFRDRGDRVEYLPMEFVETALDQWDEEERENPAEGLTEEGVARAVEALAYDIREHFWDQGFYPFRLQEATAEILRVGEQIREGEIEVDPLAFDPIPYSELPSGPVSDIQSLMEEIGDLRTVEEYAEEEIMPFIEEDMETRPFDPFAEEDLLPLVKRQLRTASDWQSTGYLMPDGTPLSLGGRGARRRDHRDVHVPDRLIPDWLDPDRNFSSMVAIIEAGVIRVKPNGSLGIDMHNEPTGEQKEWIRRSILSSNPPSEVVVDVSKPGEGSTESDSARLSPLPRKVIRFIEDFYSDRGGSKVARFRRENPGGTLSEQMARLYPSWKPRDGRSKIDARHVKWIMPGGQAIGETGEHGEDIHHNQFELPEGFDADEMPRRELVDRGALSVWITAMSGLDHVSVNVVSGAPLTDAQKTTVRDLVAEIGADKVVGALSDARDGDLKSVPSTQVEADSAEAFIERTEEFYGSDAPRRNPGGEDPAYVLAVGDTQSANLQNFKPNSQRLVTMSPGKYLKHVREHFEDNPGGDFETARESITRESPHISDERIQEMKERMTGRKPLDALWFDVRLGQQGTDSPIIGQEGRHRAISAKELGIRHVPVILWAHRQKKGKGMFGGMADVKVPAQGEEFPERVMAGATEIDWPESPTATETLWRQAKFGREFA